MAVKAVGSITVASITDVASTTRWYLLQSSTLAAPAKPTASPPGGSWAATEPTYAEGSTNSLYTCDLTVFSDGTWAYSSVSLSSSYEAAKAAYNKALAAAKAAASLSRLIRETDDGVDVGKSADGTTYAEGSMVTRQGTDGTFKILKALSGVLTTVASFGESVIELGKNSTSAVIKLCGGLATIAARTWTYGTTTYTGITTKSPDGASMECDSPYDGEPTRVAVEKTSPSGEAGGCVSLEGQWLFAKDPSLAADGANVHMSALHALLVGMDTHVVAGESAVTLGSRFATMLSDTGWTWIASYGGGDGIRWRCVGGTVYVQAAIYGERTVGSGGWNAGTIPAAYRPSSDVAVAGVSFGSLTNPTQLRAKSDGTVNLWAPSNTNYFGGSLSYPLEA